MIDPMSVREETSTEVWLVRSKVATSLKPLGTVIGIQLVAVFQCPVGGLRFQVALPP